MADRTSTMITRLDFIGIPSQDADRARSFYRDTLGLRPDEHGDYEQWAGDTCFGIWEPEKMGMPFVAQKGNPWALGCDDVAATRAELEAKGVEFAGETSDTGVCHMAFFSDPDGNDLCSTTGTRPPTEPSRQVCRSRGCCVADRSWTWHTAAVIDKERRILAVSATVARRGVRWACRSRGVCGVGR